MSIIVPSYNQGRYIAETLESILAQDYRPIEVLVMDGASTDETVAIVTRFADRHPEVRWWSEPDAGVVDAVNKGLAAAAGRYAAIQSSDDIYLPGAVRTAVEALEADPGVGLVYGDFYPMDADSVPIGPPTRWAPFTVANFLSRHTIVTQYTAFFRLDVVRELGGWRGDYFVADEDLWYRMVFRTGAHKIDRVMAGSRRHDEQRDKQVATIWESYARMISELPEIGASPWRLRRAARAGRRVMVQYYDPDRSALYVPAQLWRALVGYPPAWRAIRDKSLLRPRLGRGGSDG